jgi:predicted nucleic acid-binding protein
MVHNNRPILNQIIELANKNSKTLGFFPEGAFEQKANNKQIIAATLEDKLLGYLLFAHIKSKHLASVVHLCVNSKYRRQGIACCLIRELENLLKGKVGGIRVRCREDYDANDIWPKLGFKYIQTVIGRSKTGSKLSVWRKNLPFLDLFNQLVEKEGFLVSACLDLNILSDFLKSRSLKTVGAHAIMEDWLSEIIDFHISPELYVELKRYDNKNKVSEIKTLAKRNSEITASLSDFQLSRGKIQDLFNDTSNDQSDLNHLAWCGAEKIEYFVTSDEQLLKKDRIINNRIGVKIIHPSDLILRTDILLRASEYQPLRFGESEILIRRFAEDDFEMLEIALNSEMPEGFRSFKTKLRSYFARPNLYDTYLISQDQNIFGIICYGKTKLSILDVSILRIKNNIHGRTISLGLLNWLIQKSIDNNAICLRIIDDHSSSLLSKACMELGFFPEKNGYIRWTERRIIDAQNMDELLDADNLKIIFPDNYLIEVKNNIDRAIGANSEALLLRAEQAMWPMKFTNLKMPSYIVCIKPQYARHLFDNQISRDDLFPGDFKLLFNIENSYYKTIMGPKLQEPGRILWYVSKSHVHNSNCQAVRAVSYLNEVHTGKPKELFGRFEHLGIFKWDNVFKIAKGNIENMVMAFVFSHTEILKKPVSLTALNIIWNNEKDKNFHIQAPVKISDNIFWKIYKLGMEM